MNMVDQKQAYQTIATGWSVEQNPGFDLWGDYQYASGYDDSGWWVELKVALKDLGVDVRHGYVTGAQFRYFHIASGVWFAWTPAGYSPAGYGHLLLVDEPVSTEQALTLIYPNWRNMTIRMPQADKVVLVDRGQFVETSYQEAVMKELNGLRQKRRQIGQKAASATRLEAKAMFANLDKTLADIEADIAKVGSFNASDMTRLRQPMDNVAFALREAEANVAVKKLLAQ
jgi:hypothetical protein